MSKRIWTTVFVLVLASLLVLSVGVAGAAPLAQATIAELFFSEYDGGAVYLFVYIDGAGGSLEVETTNGLYLTNFYEPKAGATLSGCLSWPTVRCQKITWQDVAVGTYYIKIYGSPPTYVEAEARIGESVASATYPDPPTPVPTPPLLLKKVFLCSILKGAR